VQIKRVLKEELLSNSEEREVNSQLITSNQGSTPIDIPVTRKTERE
jgi:hypothetical protein